MKQKFILSLGLCVVNLLLFAQQKGYYRTPCLFKNTLVFTAEGDLWKYDLTSGNTARLTSHPGLEIFPSISPDGLQVAFVGQYEGMREIYIIPINGGIPKRLTYDFSNNSTEISGWSKDGKIIYRTGKFSLLSSKQLALLNPNTLATEPLPLAEASIGCYDDANNLFFTRFPNQGSKTKRYKGGLIEQVWKFDGTHEAINLTADFEGTSTRPMYYNDRVYFVSDRDGTMNIWSMDGDGKNLVQHTHSKGWDILSPNLYQSSIVYQKGADIWMYDIKSNTEKMLDINLISDFDQRKPKWIKSPVNTISYSDISPNGNYAAIISRGRLFVSPSKSDRWVEVSRKSGVRFKEVHFVNNKSVALLSDQSGEFEIWKMNADGSETARQITQNSTTLITAFAFSPNEKYVAYNDKNEVLRVADANSGNVLFTYDSAFGGNYEMVWSPDSRFLTYTIGIENQNAQIQVLDMNTMKTLPITTSRLNSYNPSWSADSNWLYFISERNLHTKVESPWGLRQPEPYYTETANIYAIPLDSSVKFPFLQKDSWLTDSIFTAPEKLEIKKPVANKKSKPQPVAPKVYNWSTALQALYMVPTKSANIGSLAIASDYIYWIDQGTANDDKGGKLFALKIEESKKYEPTEVASGVASFKLSADKKKVLINFASKELAIADADGKKLDMDETRLVLNNWNFVVNPPEDWKQMYDDAWRMMRDYFYDRKMHGVNWAEVKKQYEPLLSRISDRYELDNLISQMVGELSALHTFVYGGEQRNSPDQIQIGFLGADLQPSNNGVVIKHIYQNDPDYPETSSPLRKPELRIKEGDRVIAINNVPVNSDATIAELLANKVGIPVKLSLLDKQLKPYEQVVKPFSAYEEYNLHYTEWELKARNTVDNTSNSEIGYIHLRAMGGENMDEFVKQFYPVFTRKGLILDVRHNNGGNIDSWVLEKLMRKAWMYWQGRSGGPTWNMQYAFRGHMVILCDQATASDGEAVTEGFRRLGLGKVIGMRTWGGEIWLSGSNKLVDNGIASAAEFGVFGPEGKWLIEGRGVEPDIMVDNLPHETYKGKDAQLEYAIDYLQKLIKEQPIPAIQVPPHPDKSFDYKNK